MPDAAIPPKPSEVAVQAILRTEEIAKRPNRKPNYQAENTAIQLIVRAMADSPETMLDELVRAACHLTGAGSAGVSLLDEQADPPVFRWVATAGDYEKYLGGTMPRSASPCGSVLDRQSTLVMEDPGPIYGFQGQISPDVREVMLVPFHRNGKTIGTVWVVSHNPAKRFVAEDLRVMEDLSQIAAVAHQVMTAAPKAA